MAGALTEKELAHRLYTTLQRVCCPLVEDLYLQEADSMLQLLCTPLQHRTDILAWICSRIDSNFGKSKAKSMRSKDPDGLTKDIAALGQELMLCKADDLDLIRGNASPQRQLQFIEQLLTLVQGCIKTSEHRTDGDVLLNQLFAAENLPHLMEMLNPTLNPWPADIEDLHKGNKSADKPRREEAADVAALLQSTQLELEQLQSKCEFLNKESSTATIFSATALRVAACDLQRLMSTFSHVYETDLRAYCSRDTPRFSADADVFQRVHKLLLACKTELEMLKEVSEASASVSEDVKQLQTKPCYWSKGEKRTLVQKSEELQIRIEHLLLQLPS